MGKLALHYYRPDFTAEQAKMLMGDYLDDLEPYSAADVARACEEYRKHPKSEFFPKIGQLIGLLTPMKSEWEIPPSKLPRFRSPRMLTGPRPVFKSVAEILRQNGMEAAAERYEAAKGK